MYRTKIFCEKVIETVLNKMTITYYNIALLESQKFIVKINKSQNSSQVQNSSEREQTVLDQRRRI